MKSVINALLWFFGIVAFAIFLLMFAFFDSDAGRIFVKVFNWTTGDLPALIAAIVIYGVSLVLFAWVQDLLYQLARFILSRVKFGFWVSLPLGLAVLAPAPLVLADTWHNVPNLIVSAVLFLIPAVFTVRWLRRSQRLEDVQPGKSAVDAPHVDLMDVPDSWR